MKVILGETSVVGCPSTRVMKSVFQEKKEGPGAAEVQETEGGLEVLKIDGEEGVQRETLTKIGLVEAADPAVEAQGGTATGKFDIAF